MVKIMSVQKIEIVDAVKDMSWLDVLTNSILRSRKNEKSICYGLELDQAQWSRIKSGSAYFPPEKLSNFCELVNDDLPLHWLAYQRGYELRVIPKTLEEELLKERAEKEELQKKLSMMNEILEKLGAKINYTEEK